jgi:allantoicase
MSFESLPDLASRPLGGGIVHANDEFFAPADRLVEPAAPTFAAGTFGAKGQVYDGWETRRRRETGHDHAIARLGAPGVVRGVVIDTSFFTGNFPPYASVEACGLEGYPAPAELAAADWRPLVPRSPLKGDARNAFAVDATHRFTHVRLSIYPDGGVARLRVHGEPVPDPRPLADLPIDLAAVEHGGLVLDCSDRFYGSPTNLLLPGVARTMGEGWETARRRDGGNDWVLVRLAAPGRIRLAELDTSHFKGNAPARAGLRGAFVGTGRDGPDRGDWFELLPPTDLRPDTRHRFRIAGAPMATHVRLDAFPDGGMARLRLYARLTPDTLRSLALRWFNLLPDAHARQVLMGAGGSAAAADELISARPLADMAALPRRLWPVDPVDPVDPADRVDP